MLYTVLFGLAYCYLAVFIALLAVSVLFTVVLHLCMLVRLTRQLHVALVAER